MDSDLRGRIKELQQELRRLSDEELMSAHEKACEESGDGKGNAAQLLATMNEVRRRYVAAAWFWRRRRNPDNYQKWVSHERKMELKTTQISIKDLRAPNDPKSQEILGKLKQREKELSE
ncbi:hypothetical protein ACFLWB_00455 [Chloroflexota bacterium]